jgi:hypothetical protein
MDEVMVKLDSLLALPLILDERTSLRKAQKALKSTLSHPLQIAREPRRLLIHGLSAFLDLVINGRELEPQGDSSFTWELWEYVDAIESTCDRQTTRYEDITTNPSLRDYQPVERRRKRTPLSKGENTYFGVERRSGTESEMTVVIGSAANLDGIDEVLDWSG